MVPVEAQKPRKEAVPTRLLKPKEKKPSLKVAKEIVGEEVRKEIIKKVSPKVERKIVQKFATCITAGFVASTGIFVALGETGNLPEHFQEWYDETAQPIREMFGIEEIGPETVKVSEQTQIQEEIPFTGLEIRGLNHVFQNGRWEYVDPKDGLVAGFWNEEKGKFELTSNVLRGEWEGLFTSALQERQILEDSLKENKEWNKENWEKGEIKIPIPFDITKGGMIEKRTFMAIVSDFSFKATVLMVRDLPSYPETTIYAPFPSNDIQIGEGSGIQSYSVARGDTMMTINFPHIYENFLGPDFVPLFQEGRELGEPTDIKVGTPLVKLDGNDVLPLGLLRIFNPLLKGQYQLLLTLDMEIGSKSEPVNFSFENFLQDKEGRFIYLGPTTMEIIEKETKEAPLIKGLKYEEEKENYLTDKNNPYGLEAGVEAGVFLKEAFNMNGKITSAIGLRPEVIEYFQEKTKEKGELIIPLPFDLKKGVYLKIREDKSPFDGSSLLSLNLYSDTEKIIIYSPVEAICIYGYSYSGEGEARKEYKTFNFPLGNKLELSMEFEGAGFAWSEDEQREVKVGTPVGQIIFSRGKEYSGSITQHYNKEDHTYQGEDIRLENIQEIGGVKVFIFLPNE